MESTVETSHTGGISKPKPALAPKPRLTPKPFSLQKNTTIRSIHAPKTAPATSKTTTKQTGKSEAAGVPRLTSTSPAKKPTTSESKPSSVSVFTKPETTKESKASPHGEDTLDSSVRKSDPAPQTTPPKETLKSELIQKGDIIQTNYKTSTDIVSNSEQNDEKKKEDETPDETPVIQKPEDLGSDVSSAANPTHRWGSTRKRLPMELTSKFDSGGSPPLKPSITISTTSAEEDANKPSDPQQSQAASEPSTRASDESGLKDDYSGGGSIKRRISLLFDSSSRPEVITKREEPEMINGTGGVKERIKNWATEMSSEGPKTERPQVLPRTRSKSFEPATAPAADKTPKMPPVEPPATGTSSSSQVVDLSSKVSRAERPTETPMEISKDAPTDDKSPERQSERSGEHIQNKSKEGDVQLRDRCPSTSATNEGDTAVSGQHAPKRDNVKRRSVRFGVVETDDGGPPVMLGSEPESSDEEKEKDATEDDAEEDAPVSVPVYRRVGLFQNRDDEVKEQEAERLRHLEFEKKRAEEIEKARLKLEEERQIKEKEEEEREKAKARQREEEERERLKEEQMERQRKQEWERERLREEENERERLREEEMERERQMEVMWQRQREEERERAKQKEDRLRQDQEERERARLKREEERKEERLREERERQRLRMEEERSIHEHEEHRLEGKRREEEMNKEKQREEEWEREWVNKTQRLRGEEEDRKQEKELELMRQRKTEEDRLRARQKEERLRQEEMERERLRVEAEEREKELELMRQRKTEEDRLRARQKEERLRQEEMERERLRVEAEERERHRRLKEQQEKEEEMERMRQIEMEKQREEEKREEERKRQREKERVEELERKIREELERKRSQDLEEKLRIQGARESAVDGSHLISFYSENVPYKSQPPYSPLAKTHESTQSQIEVVYDDFSVRQPLIEVDFDDFSVKPKRWGSQAKAETSPVVQSWAADPVNKEESKVPEQVEKPDSPEPTLAQESLVLKEAFQRPEEEQLISMEMEVEEEEMEEEMEEERDEEKKEDEGEEEEDRNEAQVNSYCTNGEDKDTDALIHNEPDQQNEVCEETSEDDSPKAIPDQETEVPSGDIDTTDFHRVEELASFPESSAPLLDTSAQRSKADLGKRRIRSRPSRSLRASLEHRKSPDWRTRDSTDEKEASSKQRESDSEEEQPKPKMVCSPPPTSQKVPIFPGLSPAALLAQIKRKTGGGGAVGGEETEEEKGREEKKSQNEEVAPSPSQLSRSPRSAAHLAGAARVLPPLGGTEGGATSSPAWLKELKSKKRLSQYDNET